jgi:hypothetical protein
MIYLLLFGAFLVSVANLINATEEASWELLFQLIQSKL